MDATEYFFAPLHKQDSSNTLWIGSIVGTEQNPIVFWTALNTYAVSSTFKKFYWKNNSSTWNCYFFYVHHKYMTKKSSFNSEKGVRIMHERMLTVAFMNELTWAGKIV